MLHVFSMTSTLCALFENKITFEQLAEAKFYFGCQRMHVLRDDGLVPYEATWKNKDRKIGSSASDGYSRPIEHVDEDKRPIVLAFIEMIQKADTENRVRWSYSQHEFRQDILDTLPEDDLIMRSGEICTVGDDKK